MNSTDYISHLTINGQAYRFFDTPKAFAAMGEDYQRLPVSLRVLAENVLRHTDQPEDLLRVLARRDRSKDLPFSPARVVLQDLLGTPALVDLAGLRDALQDQGQDPQRVNPAVPTHLVIDHSLNVEHWGDASAQRDNETIERERNAERFSFLDWCDQAFDNLAIIPSGKGILHQINLERLTPVIAATQKNGATWLHPDTLVGTDSHTTMINAIGVLGWGVGGIEAEAAMLGKSLAIRIPEIVGIHLDGTLPSGYLATDISLMIAEKLRQENVIGCYLEFFGPGVNQLSLADRGTISNMAPEFGATAAIFAIDEQTLRYMRITGRGGEMAQRTQQYAEHQGLLNDSLTQVDYDRVVSFDLATVQRAISGPKKPHQRIVLGQSEKANGALSDKLEDDSVVLAAITSCTNTSNPKNVLCAGLVARNARKRGLVRAPWVKTSFAPGSRVVSGYLAASGLQEDLDALGFNVVGYGCTTCNGMSGPLINKEVEDQVRSQKLNTVAVTSGNRNFEGRVHPLAREVFIMAPPLIVAYAIAGTYRFDPLKDALGMDADGTPVYLDELWPSDEELAALEQSSLTESLFTREYADIASSSDIIVKARQNDTPATYAWQPESTYIQRPPYWTPELGPVDPHRDLIDMRPLAILGDHITTDHISPSGAILPESDAGQFLQAKGVSPAEFNSYGTRRGNHEVAQRATFASPRLKNEMLADEQEGPITLLMPEKRQISIFEAACEYATRKQPLVVIAGKEYGSGSSRDWAAKGPRLLGVRVVVAESFERIHRTNLAGLGILPVEFTAGDTRLSLALTGEETFSLKGIDGNFQPGDTLTLSITRPDGQTRDVRVKCRLDTFEEVRFFRSGGLLPQLRNEYLGIQQETATP